MSLTLLEQPNLVRSGAVPLVDRYGRPDTYPPLPVADRVHFRRTYCLNDALTFLPRKEVLSFEEIDQIASAFVSREVKKIRLTGGEPLVRRDIMGLVEKIGGHIGHGLEELTLTTNGS